MLAIPDRPLTTAEAIGLAAWAYAPPFDLYDGGGPESIQVLSTHDEAGFGYYPVVDGAEVVGFVCFGAEARVAGQQEEAGCCDIGAGLHPDRVSQGLATSLLPTAIRLGSSRFGVHRFRAAVAAFNTRSLRLCLAGGFVPVREFDGPGGRLFVELVLDLSEP